MPVNPCFYELFVIIFIFPQRKSEFIEKYENLIRMKNNTIYEVNKYAPYAYDAILVLARALNATEEILKKMNQSLLQFTYARQDITDIIQKKIRETSTIKGITVG